MQFPLGERPTANGREKIDHKGQKFTFWTKNDKIQVYRSKNEISFIISYFINRPSQKEDRGSQLLSNILTGSPQ